MFVFLVLPQNAHPPRAENEFTLKWRTKAPAAGAECKTHSHYTGLGVGGG